MENLIWSILFLIYVTGLSICVGYCVWFLYQLINDNKIRDPIGDAYLEMYHKRLKEEEEMPYIPPWITNRLQ